jgi:[ribosomal protein S18]-alanine N-acetyltransferase
MHQELPITIREAGEEDLDSLCSIEEAGSKRWKKQFFIDELGHNFSTILLAESEKGPCGFAVIWHLPWETQLNNLSVLPKFRRYGVATRLLDYARKDYCREKCEKILLEVREGNSGARSFYRHYGFQERGFRPKYYGDEGAVLMELPIV